MWQRSCTAAILVWCVAGCGPSGTSLNVTPVSGVVMLDDQPLANADVTAIPVNNTEGLGGSTRTNDQGEFQLLHARGERGLPPGDYKLTVSLRKRPDGSVLPINDPTPPIESDAVETLPPVYSDPQATTLTMNVSAGDQPHTIQLKSAQK